MVKKWAAKYQAEMNETWNNDEGIPVSGATVEVSSDESSNIFVDTTNRSIDVTVPFYNNDSPTSEVYIENVATPVAITDHQYYQSVENRISRKDEGKYGY